MTTVNDAQQVRVQEGAAEPRLTWRRDEQNHFVRRWPWAQRTLAHIRELRTLAEFVRDQTPTSAGNAGNRVLLKDAESHLDVAENAVLGARWLWRGSAVDGALANMDAAHALLLQVAPRQDVRAMLPDLTEVVESNLPPHDHRRKAIVEWVETHTRPASWFIPQQARRGVPEGNGKVPTTLQRRTIADAIRAAYRVREDEVIRERSFNYLVYTWTAGLFGIAFLIALLGFAFPTALPLCFSPEPPIPPAAATVACPTEDSPRAGDYLLVELAGLISAAVTSAGALHEIKGSPTATNVPVALAVLKLPTGALTAVLGIVLLRGEFVPGLSALDTPAQIIAWAVVLGAAQQLFTRFVDARGSAVMRAVPDSNPEPPRKSEEKTPVRA